MNQEQRNKIIESMIYEEAQRRRLTGNSDISKTRSKNWTYKILGIAAGVGILFFASLQLINTKELNRSSAVSEAYNFPQINKTRSNSTTNDFIEDIKNKNYENILNALRGQQLEEREQYLLMHVYFALDSIDQVSNIRNNYQFQEIDYVEDSEWLGFLIAYKKGASKVKLMKMVDQLPKVYQAKALALIEKLQ